METRESWTPCFLCRSLLIEVLLYLMIYIMYLKIYANHIKGSKLWQLSTCSVIALPKYIHVCTLLQTENSMTGGTYMGAVLIQIWLKSMKE